MSLVNYTNLEDGQKVTANIFNERFGDVIAQVNGNLDQTNFKNGGIPVEALSQSVFNKIFPVGSLYFNASDSTNPGTLLGVGTWTQYAKGEVVVGYNADDTDFNVAEKTGGSKEHTHTLSSAGAAMIGSPNGDAGRLGFKSSQAGDLSGNLYNVPGSSSFQLGSSNPTRSHNTSLTGNTDSGTALNPYITVYIWKRTA